MMIMSYDEWYKQLRWCRTKIITPENIIIDKTQFLTKKNYDIKKQNDYLKNIYYQKYYIFGFDEISKCKCLNSCKNCFSGKCNICGKKM